MPTTGPAHLSIFTGLLPRDHGALENAAPLPAEQRGRDLAARLAARGFATAAFVTSRLLAPPATGLEGFEVYEAPRGALRPGAEAVAAALAWLRVERRRPVFLWVHLYDAHAPYGDADTKRRSFPVDGRLYGFVDPLGLSAAERARMAALYRDGVASADAALGALLAGVDAELGPGAALVVVAADHGESLDERLDERGYAYDHGEFLDPECVEVPLVVAGPGVAAGRSPRAVSLRDVYTTLLEAGGAGDPDARREGRVDLREAARGERAVGIERRALGRRERAEVRSHRAAATDGRALVVVDEAGAHSGGDPDREDLEALARTLAGAERAPRRLPDVDPEIREALRSLGYSE
jgi:arylsulfatase A-like enzyme